MSRKTQGRDCGTGLPDGHPAAGLYRRRLFLGLEPALAVGMMLLAASPGGTSANLYSHLADGDVALNISLTAINSALSIVTLALFVNSSLTHFFSEGQAIPLQFAKLMQVFVIILARC